MTVAAKKGKKKKKKGKDDSRRRQQKKKGRKFVWFKKGGLPSSRKKKEKEKEKEGESRAPLFISLLSPPFFSGFRWYPVEFSGAERRERGERELHSGPFLLYFLEGVRARVMKDASDLKKIELIICGDHQPPFLF